VIHMDRFYNHRFYNDRFYKRFSQLTLTVGLIVLFGAPLCADETWYFEDTVIVGTHSGDATVTGYVTVANSGPFAGNWIGPSSITMIGPFGTFFDNGSQLEFDEGDTEWTDDTVLFTASMPSDNLALTVDPLLNFSFTSAGLPVVDTYSLVSGELVRVDPTPEPGTAPLMLIGALALGAAVLQRRTGFRLRRS
jgi:hypothetical protein